MQIFASIEIIHPRTQISVSWLDAPIYFILIINLKPKGPPEIPVN